MIRHLRLACFVLALLGLTASSSAAERFGIVLHPKGDVLGIVDGKLYVLTTGGPPGADWDLQVVEQGSTTIRVRSRDKWNDWGLTFDPAGKDKTVFLSYKESVGTRWRMVKVGRGPSIFLIQAVGGKLDGWYLDMEEKGEQFVDERGERFTAYRVILSEKPGRIKKLSIFEIGQ